MRSTSAVIATLVAGLALLQPSPSLSLADREEQIGAQLDERANEAVLAFESDGIGAPREEAARALKRLRSTVLNEESASAEPAISLCRPTPISLCLLGRFVVVGLFENPYSAPGVLVPAGGTQLTVASGYMWWFSPTVMEIPIKMVDFCGSGQGFKVFAAGLTDFGVSLGVLDMVTGVQKNYVNPARQVFDTIIDNNPPWPCF